MNGIDFADFKLDLGPFNACCVDIEEPPASYPTGGRVVNYMTDGGPMQHRVEHCQRGCWFDVPLMDLGICIDSEESDCHDKLIQAIGLTIINQIYLLTTSSDGYGLEPYLANLSIPIVSTRMWNDGMGKMCATVKLGIVLFGHAIDADCSGAS